MKLILMKVFRIKKFSVFSFLSNILVTRIVNEIGSIFMKYLIFYSDGSHSTVNQSSKSHMYVTRVVTR